MDILGKYTLYLNSRYVVVVCVVHRSFVGMSHFCVAQNQPNFRNNYLPDGLNEEIVNISEYSVEILSINLELGDIKKVREHISENSFYSFSNYSANKEKHVITKYFRCHHSQAPLSKVQKRKLATG